MPGNNEGFTAACRRIEIGVNTHTNTPLERRISAARQEKTESQIPIHAESRERDPGILIVEGPERIMQSTWLDLRPGPRWK